MMPHGAMRGRLVAEQSMEGCARTETITSVRSVRPDAPVGCLRCMTAALDPT